MKKFLPRSMSAPTSPSSSGSRSRANSVPPAEENVIVRAQVHENPTMAAQEEEPCAVCLGTHPGQVCPIIDENFDVQAPTAPPAEKPRQEADETNVRNVVELNQLLGNRVIDGNQVSELLNDVCDRLSKTILKKVESNTAAFERLKNEVRTNKRLNEIQNEDTSEKLSDIVCRSNPCTPYMSDIEHIKLPSNLVANSMQRTSLERFWRLERVFRNVPTFKDDNKPVVRDFLNAVVSVANTLPLSVMMTKEEYYQMLWGKLGAAVQAELKDFSSITDGDPENLHNALLENYDTSERGDEAFIKLQHLQPSHQLGSVNAFLREAKRLKELSPGSDVEKARGFAISIRNFLPYRLQKQLEDVFRQYKAKFKSHPEWPFLASFLKVHKDEIEKDLPRIVARQVRNLAVEKDYDFWEKDPESEEDLGDQEDPESEEDLYYQADLDDQEDLDDQDDLDDQEDLDDQDETEDDLEDYL